MPAPVSSRPYPLGTRLPGAPYVIEAWLGEGGMGVVYDGRHVPTGERRAIKVLSPRGAKKRDFARRLVREGEILSRIRSPNFVRVHDVGWLDDGRPYFAMDRLHGETLRAALGRGPLPPSRACGFVYQALGALDHLHRVRVVHRDVKPENLFVRASDGVCVLLDFGLVKLLTDGGLFGPLNFSTKKGVVLGTVRYLAPEVSQGGRPDTRADVYAAGVVLAELLAGGLSFGELGPTEYLQRVKRHGFEVPPNVPARLRHVIAGATASDPDERYPSVSFLASELGWACQSAGIDIAGARPVRPPPSRARRAFGVVPAALLGGAWAASALAVTWHTSAPTSVPISAEPRPIARAAAAVSPAPSAVATAEPPAEAPPAKAPPAEAHAPRPPAPSAPEQRARLEVKRAALEATLRAGQGDLNEIHALRRVCAELGDKVCYERSYAYLDRLVGLR